MDDTETQARALLCKAVGSPEATFHDGQLEAIKALADESARLLVVERTGWGKSMVYFIATSLLRCAGRGPTLIVSPLLSLMRNQLISAGRLGLRAETINCENSDDHEAILNRIADDDVDLLLIAPERFANTEFRERVLASLGQRVGMMVIDEAHCISDWGHDFRPDYRRIARVVQAIPTNLPVLATTATANNRVVQDVLEQIGDHARIVRGSLRRDTLRLQNVRLPDYAARLAWLAGALPHLEGSGIVYVLTKRDAEMVSRWLREHEIDALSYHGSTENREALEYALLSNDVKALVATTALGMGFDKSDLGFVVHFQRPGSAVHYYQQVGRAGRGIPSAYGVLLAGEEDDAISEYFIENALLPAALIRNVVRAIRGSGAEGMSSRQLSAKFNVRQGRMDQLLKVLETESPTPATKEGSRWYSTPTNWEYDESRGERLADVRRMEQTRMAEYVDTPECLQVFLARELDSQDLTPCGQCSNCVGKPLLSTDIDRVLLQDALDFLRRLDLEIPPRKQWPQDALFAAHGWQGNIPSSLRCSEGRALCRWGDPGWGQLVRDGKHGGHFEGALVDAAAALLAERWRPDPWPTWATFVPSLRHEATVSEFADRLASRLNLPVLACVRKVHETSPQKNMNDSWNQARNLAGAFAVDDANLPEGPVLLIDDMVDSRWTFTIVGALLRQAGAGPVFPFALADTSQSGE